MDSMFDEERHKANELDSCGIIDISIRPKAAPRPPTKPEEQPGWGES